MSKVCLALLTSLIVALTLASNQAFAQSRTSQNGSSASRGSFPSHHHRRPIRTFLPTVGGFYAGSFDGLPNTYRPTYTEPRFTSTYIIPWNWVHRCPPMPAALNPLSLPPVRTLGCTSQAATVTSADGKDRTVDIVRC